jgi:hypothetical protein
MILKLLAGAIAGIILVLVIVALDIDWRIRR